MSLMRHEKQAKLRQEAAGHYVYLYRDEKGKAVYVGYGENHKRAASHSSGSHNEGLNAFLENRKFILEIAGPFGSEDAGRAVEATLISALQPTFNCHPGPTNYRFRPFGLPSDFADRLLAPPLERRDFLHPVNGSPLCPVLFVYVSEKDFEDGRRGYNPSNPPTDGEILGRMDRWWQIGRHVEIWRKNPGQSPSLLLGLTGRPDHRFIIGAVVIDRKRWDSAKKKDGLYSVPTMGPINLDAFELRGRLMSSEANIKFGSLSSQFFIILGPDGSVSGGHPAFRS